MKTGFNILVESQQQNVLGEELVLKIEAILCELMQSAMVTAGEYANSAKRNCVTSTDMRYAMIYEAHEFWNRPDLEEKMVEHMKHLQEDDLEEDESEYEFCSDDEDNEEEPLSKSQDSDPDDAFCRASDGVSAKIALINKYVDEWASWNPDDPIKSALKNAIDSRL